MLTILELTANHESNNKITVIADNIQSINNNFEIGGADIFFGNDDVVYVKETREEITALLRGDVAKEPQPKELSILNESIDRFEFTIRTLNGLKSENIKTIGQLIEWEPRGILSIPNLGKKSLTEIIDCLANVGLSLAK